MNPSYTGELAALAASLFFTATSTTFTLAGKQVGSVVVNRSRLALGVIFLIIAHLLLGAPFPLHAGAERWFWLGLSGVFSFVLGDAFLFQAFLWIGPRLAMLIRSLTPVIAAVLAWLFLAEALTAWQIAGILITVAGVAWVVLEKRAQVETSALDRRNYIKGILFGFGAATGQAVGLITAKMGSSGDFSPLSGTLMRVLAAAALLWALALFSRQAKGTLQAVLTYPRALNLILLGAFVGPFLGVTLSLLAVQRTEVGIASTLMALPPVFLLPISYFLFKERFGWQAVLGTMVALAGVGLLFLV